MTPTPVKYDINPESGEIRRIQGSEDLLIANIVDGQVVYTSDEFKKYDPVVRRRINEARREEKREAKAAALNPPPANPQSETVIAGPTVVTQVPSMTMISLTVEQRKAVNYLRRQEGFPDEVESPAPDAPRKGAYGDKNPEFVTHLLRYDPEEFVRRYGVIEMGQIEDKRYVLDTATSRRKIEKFMQKGVIARRKTQYTLTDMARQGVKDE